MADGILKVPIGNGQYFDIELNHYSRQVLSDPLLQIRSFTLTPDSVSICFSKEVEEIKVIDCFGIDRNLRNLTVGNDKGITNYDLSKAVDIVENTRAVVRSFRRGDARIRQKLYAKYGGRRRHRVNQMIHRVSNMVAQNAKKSQTALAFEDIRMIRQLYQRGNGQGSSFRSRLTGWSFAEIKRLIMYKAAWEGIQSFNYQKVKREAHPSSVRNAGRR